MAPPHDPMVVLFPNDPPSPIYGGKALAKRLCYDTFSTTFTGTDAFTFRVRDGEGSVSNVAVVTITIFEQ